MHAYYTHDWGTPTAIPMWTPELEAELRAVDADFERYVEDVFGREEELLSNEEEFQVWLDATFGPAPQLEQAERARQDEEAEAVWREQRDAYYADLEARQGFDEARDRYQDMGRTGPMGSARYWEQDPELQAMAQEFAREAA